MSFSVNRFLWVELMGGPTHKRVGPPIVTHGTNKDGHSSGGSNGRTMHTTPLSGGEPIGWGAIKTHCTAMDSVAANRRLKVISKKKPQKILRVAIWASIGSGQMGSYANGVGRI